MKIKIVKFIQCDPCSIKGLKLLELSLFETFYITIGHLLFVTFIDFIYITPKVFVVKILGQIFLFKHSL